MHEELSVATWSLVGFYGSLGPALVRRLLDSHSLARLRVVHGGGLVETAREYGLGVIVLAASALAGTMTRRPRLVPVTPATGTSR